MCERVVEEVLSLHRFLSVWLTGEVKRDDLVFERFANALAEDFSVIHPNGVMQGKQEVLRNFREAHGNKQRGFRLEISAVQPRKLAANLYLVTYNETHAGESGRNRICSALIHYGDETFQWLNLHETLRGDASK